MMLTAGAFLGVVSEICAQVETRCKTELDKSFKYVISFAHPNALQGQQHACRVTFLLNIGPKNKVNVWSGIVSDKSLESVKSLREGMFGCINGKYKKNGGSR